MHKDELLENRKRIESNQSLQKIEPLKKKIILQLVWVTEARYMGGYKIAVTFNDGKSKTVDLESHSTGQVLSPLKDLNLFHNFKVTGWTIEWANGSDIAPKFLYNC